MNEDEWGSFIEEVEEQVEKLQSTISMTDKKEIYQTIQSAGQALEELTIVRTDIVFKD